MYAVGRLGSYISRGVYTVSGPFHPFGGAVDIIVVQQEDGSFKSSAWNVRFGKFQGVLKSKEKVVKICVNGEEANFHMYLDNKGEAYFLREADAQEGESVLFPSSSSGDETDEQSRANRQPLETQSCSYDVESLIVDPADKVLSRKNSRKSRIFGIFGSRSMKERQTAIDEREGGDDTVGMVDSLERAEFAANLLEVKWSTTLATKKPRKGGGSRFSCPDLLESAVDEDMQISSEHRRVTSSLPDCVLETTICSDKKSNDYLSGLNEPHSYAEEAALISCLKSPDIVSRVCRELSETGATENDGNVVAVISNITGSDSPNPQSFEVESFPGKHFVGQVFDDKGGGIDRVESFIYCESSESSVGGTEGSSEQTHEKLYIARGGSGQVHVRAEAVHARTALSKDTVTEQLVGDIALKVQPEEIPKNSCNETADYNHNVDLKEPIKAPEDCSQMVHISALPGSVEGNESPILSGSSNSDHKVHDEKDFKGQDITCDVQTSSGYFSGSEMTETASVVQPGRLEEEQFLFSDSDELNITKVQCMESSSSLCVEGESSLLSSPDGSKELNEAVVGTNYHSDSSPEKFAQEKPSTGCEKCVGSIKTTSTIGIPRNHKAADKEVGRFAESLPNMWHQTDNLSALDLQTDKLSALDLHSRLSHSLDSKGRTLKWIQHSKDDLSCIEFGKEQQLPQVELDTESAQGTPELKDVPGSPAFGDPSKASITSSGSWKLWPFAFRRTNSQKAMQPNLNDGKSPDVEDASDSTITMESSNTVLTPKVMKKTERSTSPTSEQLASLNLKEGKNTVTFTFSTAMLGKQQVDARIYLWKWNTRIVISDVDGTITKSDVLGQFMPLVGVDWSQTGVTHLFSAIKENGYELLFLSARAISQSSQTRQFLFNLKQDGKALPDGPVVISPDGLFPSLFREVIRRAPHEFKIACLEDIKSLFPSDCKPFYAGFGNRDTDEFSYLKVGIPLGKIFIINPKGEVVVNRRVDSKSYTSLHALVNGMFPATTSSNVQEDFNSWNFWKLPLPDV